jgi:hypothetical protein
MATPPITEFGKRRPEVIADAVPQPKRSGHVALLLVGSFAVGGSAYALMPRQKCEPNPPGMTAPSGPQIGAACSPRGSSGAHGYWGGSSRYSLFGGGGDASSRASASPEGSGGVTRGGFGGFAEAISAHFSRGG